MSDKHAMKIIVVSPMPSVGMCNSNKWKPELVSVMLLEASVDASVEDLESSESDLLLPPPIVIGRSGRSCGELGKTSEEVPESLEAWRRLAPGALRMQAARKPQRAC